MRASLADTLIIARTDAVAVEGFDRAIERALLYREAGADRPVRRGAESRARNWRRSSALVGGGAADGQYGRRRQDADAVRQPNLKALGFSLVIFPGGIVRALAKTATEYYASLATHGSNQPFRDRMFDFNALNELIGTPEMIERGKRLASIEPVASNDAKHKR